ncbi:MAG TPA: type II secretion system secretin GspD [Kofleriaceae bacterium]
MPKRWYVFIGLLVLLPRLAVGQPHKELDPAAPTAPVAADEMLYSCGVHKGQVAVTLKPETEVRELITWAMGFSCKNFILDPRIVSTGKKVTVIAPNKMSPSEAYQMFLVALSTVGLTVVTKGNVQRIVDAGAAKREVLPIYKQVPGDSDQIVRVVIRPSFAQPEALKQAFLSIKSDAGDITVIGSMLVVTDFASTLTSMMSLKKLVDVPGGAEGIYTIPIHHGDAAKVAQMLTAMFGASPAAAGAGAGKPGAEPAASEPVPSKILVDDRTNTLVVSATEPAYQRAKALIERLDVSVDFEGGSSIHTYQLSSAIAEELAQTLTKAISGDSAASRPQRISTGSGAAVPPEAQPQTPAASALDGLSATLHGAVHVIADKSTNKLLITSSARDFVALRDVIRELDQPRRQVYIEAMILEVDVSNGINFGASAHGGTGGNGSGIGIGGVQLPQLSSLSAASAIAAGGLIGGLFGAPVPGLSGVFGSGLPAGTSISSYGVLIQALANHSNTNVLSTPSLIALDNEEAKSKIGENIPYLASTVPAVTGATGALTPLATGVSRQPLELELDIKPHISADDTILLEIKHSNGGVKDLTGPLGPTWTTRSVETRVVVRDQQTVLIGGLMQDTVNDTESKVPILGDLPLLGYLFKYTSKTKHKTNLIIMLTPYIIKDQLDLEQIRQRKLRQNDEFFRSMVRLDSMSFAPGQDYRRKRGLIEEINRAVLEVDAERAVHAAATVPAGGVPTGRVEIPDEPAAP